MKFLDVYPSKDALESRHRGIMRDIDPDKLIKLEYGPPRLAAADLIRSSHDARDLLLQAVPEKYLDQLMSTEKYTAGEILIGLRVLFRIGKGANSTYSVAFKNGVTLKYGSRKTEIAPGEQRAIIPSDEVHNKIARGVTSAREMARHAQATIAKYCTDYPDSVDKLLLTRDILICHFDRGLSEEDLPVLRDISRKYGTIARSLDGHIIIADDVGRSLGRVKHPEYESWILPLPHKTYLSNRKDPITGVEYDRLVGNIHINFNWAETGECTVKRLAKTIVHEASHKFCGTLDHAYGHETNKYGRLRPELRQQNADTYGLAAVSFDAGEVIMKSNDIK